MSKRVAEMLRDILLKTEEQKKHVQAHSASQKRLLKRLEDG